MGKQYIITIVSGKENSGKTQLLLDSISKVRNVFKDTNVIYLSSFDDNMVRSASNSLLFIDNVNELEDLHEIISIAKEYDMQIMVATTLDYKPNDPNLCPHETIVINDNLKMTTCYRP